MNRRNFLRSLVGLPLMLAGGVAAAKSLDVRDFGAVGDGTLNVDKIIRAKRILNAKSLLGWGVEQWAIVAARYPAMEPTFDGAMKLQREWLVNNYGVEPGDGSLYGIEPKDYQYAWTMLGNVRQDLQQHYGRW